METVFSIVSGVCVFFVDTVLPISTERASAVEDGVISAVALALLVFCVVVVVANLAINHEGRGGYVVVVGWLSSVFFSVEVL